MDNYTDEHQQAGRPPFRSPTMPAINPQTAGRVPNTNQSANPLPLGPAAAPPGSQTAPPPSTPPAPTAPAQKLRQLQRRLRREFNHLDQKGRVLEVAYARFRFGRTPSGEIFAVDKFGPNIVQPFPRNSQVVRDMLTRATADTFGA